MIERHRKSVDQQQEEERRAQEALGTVKAMYEKLVRDSRSREMGMESRWSEMRKLVSEQVHTTTKERQEAADAAAYYAKSMNEMTKAMKLMKDMLIGMQRRQD